jgi:hypothetical protein
MTSTTAYVRITNGTPEFITWPEARDEVNAAQMGETKKLVETMTSDDNGRTHHITYTDGRKVTIRPATDADQPAAPAKAPKLTPLMVRCLVQGRNNRDGHYATNIRNGGGTSGALLRRGLIEHRADGPRGSAYYYTAAGLELAHRLAAQG